MRPIHIKSAVDQVADHLIQEIADQSLIGYIPSAKKIASELGVNHKTVAAAVNILESKGYIVSQPSSRRRSIVVPESTSSPGLKIGMLEYDSYSVHSAKQIELSFSLREAGHRPINLEKTLTELNMDINQISKLVKKTEVDAWLLVSAPRKVIEWFAKEDLPAFAQFGLQTGIPIAGAGPDFPQAVQEVVRRFLDLGHRRIVTLMFGGRHSPPMGHTERAIITEMEKQGLPTGAYNFPNWEDNRKGFRKCLDSLFLHTPPTALFIEESPQLVAVLKYCCENGLRVPRDISLVCGEESSKFLLCEPEISHLKWDFQPIIRCAIRWANNLVKGIDDKQQSKVKVDIVEGNTIGPAPRYVK